MAYTPSFTGKGTYTPIDTRQVQEAQQGLSAIIKEAEKLRYEVYRKNYEDFLKATDIDPGFFISNAAREYMDRRMREFGAKYGKKMQESGGNLSYQDKSDMQAEGNLIESEKNGLLADQELWKQQRALIEKDMGVNLSPREFLEAQERYMRGEDKTWDHTINDFLKPEDFVGAYKSSIDDIKRLYYDTKNAVMLMGGGMRATQGTPFQNKEEGIKHFSYMLSQNPKIQKDFFNKWNQANQAAYYKQAEENAKNPNAQSWETNPMMLFFVDTVGEERINPLIQDKPTNIPRYRTAQSTTAIEKAQAKIGVQDASLPKSYGPAGDDQRTYSPKSFYFKDSGVIENIPTQGASAIGEYGAEDISAGNIDAQLVLYDPVKKIFLVKSKRPSQSTGQPSNALIEIPRENIPGYRNLTLKMGDTDITIADTDEIYKYGGKTPTKETEILKKPRPY